jgi:hypothetical protein
MKLLERAFILVKPKQDFCDWAKTKDPDFIFDASDDLEGSIYLIDDNYFDEEKVIETNFKKIIFNECQPLVEKDDEIPTIKFEQFPNWFSVEFGSTVFDTIKS